MLLLTHRTLRFFPFLPSSLELRGRSAAMAAVPPPRRESTAELELGDDQIATGDWRARPLPSLPGGGGRAETKAPARCHSCRRVRPQLQLGMQPPQKNHPMRSPRGADTPRLRSKCDTAQVKWHRRPALPERPQPHGAELQGTATSSCHHHHRVQTMVLRTADSCCAGLTHSSSQLSEHRKGCSRTVSFSSPLALAELTLRCPAAQAGGKFTFFTQFPSFTNSTPSRNTVVRGALLALLS